MKITSAAALLAIAVAAAGAEPPSASIGNGMVKATLHLPDVNDGYYRSTRFDWSGSVASLEAGGHSYFGQWFPRYDPMAHGSITGPVEDYWPLNFEDSKPGESFVKIGVGVLKRNEDKSYRFQQPYEFLDHGKWSIRKGTDFVEYRHELSDPQSGYGYVYTKTVRLTAGKPQMTIEHALRNTGKKAIATNVYNHGFFMLDNQPTGPDFTVTFPFDVKPQREMTGLAEVRGKQIVYLKELQGNLGGGQPQAGAQGGAGAAPAPAATPAAPANGQGGQGGQGRGGGPGGGGGGGGTASTIVEGFSLTDPKDFNIAIENHKTGAGVRISADVPLSKINFWSVRTTVCPEAYVDVKAEPGKEFRWRLTYDFYSVATTGK